MNKTSQFNKKYNQMCVHKLIFTLGVGVGGVAKAKPLGLGYWILTALFL